MSVARMNDVRVSARRALGKGANLRRSSPLEVMAYGGPAGDPQVTVDLNTIRALADRVGWVPQPNGWQSGEQTFTWHEVDLMIKWDSARALLVEVATKRPDFAGLETGLSTQAGCSNKKDDRTSSAVNAALGGVWHEVRTHKAFTVGETCVRCKEEPEELSHSLFRCLHWHKERRDVELPADDDTVPDCVKLHGLLPAPRVPPVLTHEPVLVNRTGVVTVWTDGSGRHSDDPQHRRCGVGYYTDTNEHLWVPVPGLRQSVYRAEFHAVVRALEECQPHEVVSDCKGVVKAIQALRAGRRTPKGRNRDLESRAMKALLPGQRIRWMKAHLKQADVDSGRVTADDFQGNQLAGLCDEGVPRLAAGRTTGRTTSPNPSAPARVPDADAPFQLGNASVL
eukprot:2666825-Amphidinium_carterae.2